MASPDDLAGGGQIVHLRVLAPPGLSDAVVAELRAQPGAFHLTRVPGAGLDPPGDLVTCDVAREAASHAVQRLRDLGVPERGAISIVHVDTQVSSAAVEAVRAAPGSPDSAVVWEQVEAQTAEAIALDGGFLVFMAVATLLAATAIFVDSAVLLVGAMVVGPEFGPLAGVCVALVEGRPRLAGRSLAALAVGFPMAIVLSWLASLLFRATGLTPDEFSSVDHSLSQVIAAPDWFTVIVALCAGIAGMLSLTASKSSVLVGVLVSVTTIPAAANMGIAWAYSDGDAFLGSLGQLALNLGLILLAGALTLAVQRAIHVRRASARR
ncbi:MAG: DUF389 domain-containing protein [Thermoleophilia bacterium]